MRMRVEALLIITCVFVLSLSQAQAATKSVTVKGSYGETLSASTSKISSGAAITVKGNYFDETVGIYLAFCVMPVKGQVPTPCGGGVNKSGTGDISYWISSNPPPYGVGLAREFQPGGRFVRTMHIGSTILTSGGKIDCRKVTCAITVRADHTREDDRTHDIYIPITFTSPKK
ncbi:MAG: hypothetical protein F2951_04325 [Actinobacteria bacterium]|nr:hypothetical protein [Actinomycetota bacterium]MTA67688.1 hypothetical protein [Actinomycetota bacterium]